MARSTKGKKKRSKRVCSQTACPIKWVVIDTDVPMLLFLQAKGLKFSVDKQYPVFKEEPGPKCGDVFYVMEDDLGQHVLVNGKYFLPAKVQLVEDLEEMPEMKELRSNIPNLGSVRRQSAKRDDLSETYRQIFVRSEQKRQKA